MSTDFIFGIAAVPVGAVLLYGIIWFFAVAPWPLARLMTFGDPAPRQRVILAKVALLSDQWRAFTIGRVSVVVTAGDNRLADMPQREVDSRLWSLFRDIEDAHSVPTAREAKTDD